MENKTSKLIMSLRDAVLVINNTYDDLNKYIKKRDKWLRNFQAFISGEMLEEFILHVENGFSEAAALTILKDKFSKIIDYIMEYNFKYNKYRFAIKYINIIISKIKEDMLKELI